jgi:hypothetical protein
MRSWKSAVSGIACGALAALVVGAATPAAADLYSWRTEDGGYAYTDDPDQIPARYRAQAKQISRRSLASYERYTVQDGAAAERYAQGIERRLAALRAANQATERAEQEAIAAAAPQTLTMSTGGTNAPQITATMTNDEPVVMEPVLIREKGDLRTRRATVVRQGDRILALLKDSQHNYNVNQDILDEAELEQGESR